MPAVAEASPETGIYHIKNNPTIPGFFEYSVRNILGENPRYVQTRQSDLPTMGADRVSRGVRVTRAVRFLDEHAFIHCAYVTELHTSDKTKTGIGIHTHMPSHRLGTAFTRAPEIMGHRQYAIRELGASSLMRYQQRHDPTNFYSHRLSEIDIVGYHDDDPSIGPGWEVPDEEEQFARFDTLQGDVDNLANLQPIILPSRYPFMYGLL